MFSTRNLRLVRKHAVRSLNGLKFVISANGRTAHWLPLDGSWLSQPRSVRGDRDGRIGSSCVSMIGVQVQFTESGEVHTSIPHASHIRSKTRKGHSCLLLSMSAYLRGRNSRPIHKRTTTHWSRINDTHSSRTIDRYSNVITKGIQDSLGLFA